jgi:1-acyl-sn-glycerol-3-phosphate acyltransferase
MNRQPYEKPPRWWSPKLSPSWMRFWRVFRMREQRRVQRLLEVDVRGLELVRDARAKGYGILITPNHASHADCFALYAASDQLGIPFYVMVAWQVFQRGNPLRRWGLRHHGCFSIDREGTDMHAMRAARGILESAPYPLVIFPEGEVYHLNDRVTPFREGPAALALLAAKKGARPIVCIPCAMKYTYVQEPTPQLLELMDRLERALLWRPRPDLTLPQRVYHLAEGMLGLKEVEYLGKTLSGPLPERIRAFMEFVLGRLELQCGLLRDGGSVPERIKIARKYLIDRLQEMPADAPARRKLEEGLDEVFLIVQAFSYPGNYVSEQPTIERIAETLDKFEEDLLGVKTATIRGARKVQVTFGQPISVAGSRGMKGGAGELTRILEQHVQTLLDQAVAETGVSDWRTNGSVHPRSADTPRESNTQGAVS